TQIAGFANRMPSPVGGNEKPGRAQAAAQKPSAGFLSPAQPCAGRWDRIGPAATAQQLRQFWTVRKRTANGSQVRPLVKASKETAMADRRKMLTAVFRDRVRAQSAYDRLTNRGYTNTEINVLMSDATRTAYVADRPAERHDLGSHAAEGMGVGGAI